MARLISRPGASRRFSGGSCRIRLEPAAGAARLMGAEAVSSADWPKSWNTPWSNAIFNQQDVHHWEAVDADKRKVPGTDWDVADYVTGPRPITPQAPACSPIATCYPKRTCVALDGGCQPWVIRPENVATKQPARTRGSRVRWSADYAASIMPQGRPGRMAEND